jgi:hypothetical protein
MRNAIITRKSGRIIKRNSGFGTRLIPPSSAISTGVFADPVNAALIAIIYSSDIPIL